MDIKINGMPLDHYVAKCVEEALKAQAEKLKKVQPSPDRYLGVNETLPMGTPVQVKNQQRQGWTDTVYLTRLGGGRQKKHLCVHTKHSNRYAQGGDYTVSSYSEIRVLPQYFDRIQPVTPGA